MPAWSGLWDGVHGQAHSLITRHTGSMSRITHEMRKPGMRKLKELMLTLNGVAPGATALATYPRVEAQADPGNPAVGGGEVPIETVTVINRVTATADKTLITEMLELDAQPAYPTDASGNGGGGKVGGYGS